LVIIKHQWQNEIIYSSYAHLDAILVAQGEYVQAAQHIGTV
jgi:murein DD-endopeptidase MepM/ murein hydrolase activator NlpD